MDAAPLPLFPLSLVLLPGMSLPLHIFEERYKEMMSEVIPSGAEFGMVLAKGGGIMNVGCTAVVRNVLRRYEDGRIDLLAQGQRRFVIGSLDQSRSFLRAEVEFFDDEEPEADLELKKRALAAFEPLLSAQGDDRQELTALTPALSFRLCELVEDLDPRQAVLTMRSESERLEFLIKMMPGYLQRQQRLELARRVGPLNGHAKYVNPAG
jgi:Lon protease-like protein